MDEVTAVLAVEGLSATRTVYHGFPSGFRDLVLLSEGMERDWRGWDGTRSWESLEGDLRIDARHAYGHVQLTVTLRRAVAEWDRSGWSATADLTIDPGEELSQIARDMQALVPV